MTAIFCKRSVGFRANVAFHAIVKAWLFFCIVFTLLFSLTMYRSLNMPSALMIETTPEYYRVASSTSVNDVDLRVLKINENRKYVNKCNSGLTLLYVVGLKADSVVNDDFCDCSDGMDEAETPACSYRLVGKRNFKCKNDRETFGSKGKDDVGYRGTSASDLDEDQKIVFASRVNDDVCDCSDCSDELSVSIGEYTSRSNILQVVRNSFLRFRLGKDEGSS